MIELTYLSLLVVLICFVFNIYLLFFKKITPNAQQNFATWKQSILVFIVILVFFFLYFGSATNTFAEKTTYDYHDGSTPITVTNSHYLDALTFFPFMLAMLPINFVLLASLIFTHFNVFGGRGRMKKRQRTY